MSDNSNILAYLRKEVEKLDGIIENNRRTIELLQPELDKFEARDAPWNTYVVRLAVDHISAQRSAIKDRGFLVEALSILEKESEHVKQPDTNQSSGSA